jgi:demethylmenaquinone methyltransferase/2-methoxy-6-polyprenyl-1,4-benzoquinol methylase
MTSDIFRHIAKRYELFNFVESFGIVSAWRFVFVKIVREDLNARNLQFQGLNILDIATGTGKTAFSLCKALQGSKITGIDKSQSMLDVAKEKQKNANAHGASSIVFKKGNAESLEFADGEFDVATFTFAGRNVKSLRKVLSEARRVLNDNGVLYMMEFSWPENPMLSTAYTLYLTKLLPFLGKLITREKKPYKYLAKSVYRWKGGKKMKRAIRGTGFKSAKVKRGFFVSIYRFSVR